MNPIINIENVSKCFGKKLILNGVSVQIESGTVYGLVGLNGAGKTTLLRLLTGLLKPDSGTVSVLKFNPWEHKREYYQKIGVVLENDGFWGNLNIKDNLGIYASAKGLHTADMEKYLDEYWKDSEIYHTTKKVKTLSRGQKMQCAICRAFMGWPEVFFLDEPALALDMTAYEHLCSIVKKARERGAAVIISSHQLDTIDKLCDRVGILQDRQLRELVIEKQTLSRWLIDTDNSEQYADVIKNSGGKDIEYDSGFIFKIDNKEKIPVIIRELVLAGCRINEVKQAQNGFGNSIRDYYIGKKGVSND
ncbi:MAG: ABC transporter ATP-binding protein [Fibrobacter sp.]|nr:ABC transporter ATP-binding protein [Fibrobacter sp.]